MPRYLWFFTTAFLGIASAHAGVLADLQIYDRTAGRTLPVHMHAGRLYVAGEPGHRYELRLYNRTHARLLAVASVDGVNVLTGQTAASGQRGYVVASHAELAVEGWRKSLDEVAAFYFTTEPDSYAARTRRPDHVGVIGVALFEETAPCCARAEENSRAQAAAPASTRDALTGSQSRLGTGHGENEVSPARLADFERAAAHPSEVIAIYYDSRKRLTARGIIPSRLPPGSPQPFPQGFVPDP